MAIARGAGTEIIRSFHADDIDATATNIIVGVQHHIYTVLSIIVHTAIWQASGNWVQAYIQGYDSKGGTTDSSHNIFRQDMSVQQTFVFNDKFSFNGTEPSSNTDDARADQGTTTSQKLIMSTENAADGAHVTVTYIDQNNS